jgi:hypothetical protein
MPASRSDKKKVSVTQYVSVTMDENRWKWLRQMAHNRGVSEAQLASDLLHNAALHFQMDVAPRSNPDDSPTTAYLKQYDNLD